MNFSISLKSRIASKLRRTSASVIPSNRPLTKTFSRPVSSGLKPTPMPMSGATFPTTRSRPVLGAETPDSSRSSVVLPDPFRPMTPTVSPCSTRKSRSRSAHISLWLRRPSRRTRLSSVASPWSVCT
jgi:hypothetical protein